MSEVDDEDTTRIWSRELELTDMDRVALVARRLRSFIPRLKAAAIPFSGFWTPSKSTFTESALARNRPIIGVELGRLGDLVGDRAVLVSGMASTWMYKYAGKR